jgi:hypothetical protein
MPSLAETHPTPPRLRRRNLRLAWTLAFLALASAAFAPFAVRHGWIYPQETTFAFPHWIK